MRVKSAEVKIYAPAHFKATWEKYLEICERDGTNASREIRRFVEGQVARRDPGNPQRTLGTFVEGHEDELAAKRSDLLKELIARAAKSDGTLSRREVIEEYKALGAKGNMRVELTRSMCEDLEKLGVKVRL